MKNNIFPTSKTVTLNGKQLYVINQLLDLALKSGGMANLNSVNELIAVLFSKEKETSVKKIEVIDDSELAEDKEEEKSTIEQINN